MLHSKIEKTKANQRCALFALSTSNTLVSQFFQYNQIVEVDMVLPASLKRCVSVSVVEIASGEYASNGAILSSFTVGLVLSSFTFGPWQR